MNSLWSMWAYMVFVLIAFGFIGGFALREDTPSWQRIPKKWFAVIIVIGALTLVGAASEVTRGYNGWWCKRDGTCYDDNICTPNGTCAIGLYIELEPIGSGNDGDKEVY